MMVSGPRDPEVGSVRPTPYRLYAYDQGRRASRQGRRPERPLWRHLSVLCRKFPDIYGYWGCPVGSGYGILLPYTGQVPSKPMARLLFRGVGTPKRLPGISKERPTTSKPLPGCLLHLLRMFARKPLLLKAHASQPLV